MNPLLNAYLGALIVANPFVWASVACTAPIMGLASVARLLEEKPRCS